MMDNPQTPLLDVRGLGKAAKEGMVSVSGISFALQPQEKLAIVGETGCGKTTLLKMIGGLVQPSGGQVLLNGQRVKGPDEQLIAGHRSIAYLSQHFELRNNYWVHEVLAYANLMPDGEAEALYAVCRIEHLLGRRTNELSGGEKQRVAMARLLSTKPQLLLLDEPFSNMDMGHKQVMKAVVADIGERLGTTCLMVSHDAADILPWADQLLVMRNGGLVQQGRPEDVYLRPVDAYCAALLGPYNKLPMAVFAGMWSGRTDAENILVRPEHLQLAEAGADTVGGTVLACRFHGSHYMATVQVDGAELLVNMGLGQVAVGQQVWLKVKAAHAF
jgi:ABC-type sugar transport system ATPase subunit